MRCFATIADALNYFLGTNLPSGPPHTYGTCVAIAFLVGAYIGYRSLKISEEKNILLPSKNKNGEEIFPHQRILEILCIALVGSIMGSRILNISDFNTLKLFLKSPFSDTGTGLTVMGGLWGGVIPLYFYFRYYKLQIAHFIDALTPAFFICTMIGRLGCQLAGDGCWGIKADMAARPAFIPNWMWGYNYPHNIANQGDAIPNCHEAYCNQLVEFVHPTPIYEIILTFIFCIFLLQFMKKYRPIPLATFGFFLVLNGLERFTIEFIRINEKISWFNMGWTKYQWISIFMFLGGLLIVINSHFERKKY